MADYYLLENPTKDRPVKFSAMLTSKGTPAFRLDGELLLITNGSQRSGHGLLVDDIKTNDKIPDRQQ